MKTTDSIPQQLLSTGKSGDYRLGTITSDLIENDGIPIAEVFYACVIYLDKKTIRYSAHKLGMTPLQAVSRAVESVQNQLPI
jgi:hypothetical protein